MNFWTCSLCYKPVAMEHAWRSVGQLELLHAERSRCRSMAKRVVWIHRSLDCSFWIKRQCWPKEGPVSNRIRTCLNWLKLTTNARWYNRLFCSICRAPVVEQLKMQVKRISMADYEANHYDKENLQASGSFPSIFELIFRNHVSKTPPQYEHLFLVWYATRIATPLGSISVSHDAVLEHVRKLVNHLLEQQAVGTSSSPVGPHGGGSPPTNGGDVDKLCPDWCFIDCTYCACCAQFNCTRISYDFYALRLYGGTRFSSRFRAGTSALHHRHINRLFVHFRSSLVSRHGKPRV